MGTQGRPDLSSCHPERALRLSAGQALRAEGSLLRDIDHSRPQCHSPCIIKGIPLSAQLASLGMTGTRMDPRLRAQLRAKFNHNPHEDRGHQGPWECMARLMRHDHIIQMLIVQLA